MKYIKMVLIVAIMCFCMTACENSSEIKSTNIESTDKETVEIQSDTAESDSENIQAEQETETEVETTAEDDNYPNYPGYPKEKDGLKLCKLYVDDYECFCDGYIKDEYPDRVFL